MRRDPDRRGLLSWLGLAPDQAPSRPSSGKPSAATPTILVDGRPLPVEIRRLRQARRMTLRLAPDGSAARVSIPHWARSTDALAFAATRADWLARQLERVPAARPIEPGMSLAFRGHSFELVWLADAARKPVLDDGSIVVGGPRAGLATRLSRWLEAQALHAFEADLADYCARAGHEVPRLGLSRAQRRWGSCAADGSIRLNWRLIMAPDFVRRSVVAHEVAHMTHFDHSPAFHAHHAALFEGSIAEADAWLKRRGRTLYQPFG